MQLDQLSLLNTPIIDSTPIRSLPAKSSGPELSPGALVVPKANDGHTPLFPDQVCEVVRMGQSLGRDRVFLVPVKWKGRGVLPFPCDSGRLILLSSAEVCDAA